MIEKIFKSNIDKLELTFKAVYLFHIILCSNIFYVDTVLNSISSAAVLLLGGVILLYRVVNFKRIITYPYFWLYVAFIFSYFISAILSAEYGFVSNLKILIWTAFFFFILYVFDQTKSNENTKKEIYFLGKEICLIAGITSAVNIWMLLSNYSGFHKVPSGKIFLVGVAYWGRLYGVVTDPNYAAVVNVVAIMLAIGFAIKCKKKAWKVLYTLCVVLNLCSLVFSASRTGLVTLCITATVYVFIYMLIEKKSLLKTILFSVAALGLVLVANKTVLVTYNAYAEFKTTLGQNGPSNGTEEEDSSDQMVEINREEELNGDVSNRRFDLWMNAGTVFAKNPITGVSFGAFVPYCKDEIPDAYMINNDSGVEFETYHNMLMDLIASQGLIGIAIFVMIIVLSLRYMWLSTRNMKEEESKLCALLFSICIGLVVSSMFVSQILYVHTQTTVIFWVLWGYLIYLCVKNKNGDVKYEY